MKMIKSLIQTSACKQIPKLIKSIAKARCVVVHVVCSIKILCKRTSSSHVIPISDYCKGNYVYYDATWRSVMPMEQCDEGGEELCQYLQWLEEEEEENSRGIDEENEIDRLAEKFIKKCHERFVLEKQESYRRFQEMLIRSI